MADIDFGQITEALNDKSDRDLRNVDTTAKADAVIDYQEPTAANNYTWYRKYKSGWVEQGGSGTWSENTEITITLPIPMKDNTYTALVSINNLYTGNQNAMCWGSAYISQAPTLIKFGTMQGGYVKSWQVSGKSAN